MAVTSGARIATNINAMNAYKALNDISKKIGTVAFRLSTGTRLNQAGDDPGSFTISRKMQAKSRSIAQAVNNTGDAKSLLGIAEGGLMNISEIMIIIKEKASQATNGTFGPDELNAVLTQVNDFLNEIDDIIAQTKFSDQRLLSGNFTGRFFQIGPDSPDQLDVSIDALVSSADFGLNELTIDNIGTAETMKKIEDALTVISMQIQYVGSLSNRLDFKEDVLNISLTNVDAAISRIYDTDLAKEQLEMVKLQILDNTATAQLAQANAMPQQYLQLFQ
jgi:flagellin